MEKSNWNWYSYWSCGCKNGPNGNFKACSDGHKYLELTKESIIQEESMSEKFTVKDSGKRQEFESGMVRDTEDDKIDFSTVLDGPMFDRIARHLTTAKAKYADIRPGVANWMQADGEEELVRFRKSAFRHFCKWFRGDTDEDHAAAVYFNINGAEYVKDKLKK